jgi:hypothetical protein
MIMKAAIARIPSATVAAAPYYYGTCKAGPE